MRSKQQKYWDRLVLLRLFQAVSKRSRVDGNLKAQKLVFLVELKAHRDGIKGAHYKFFRYQLGPFSADLANDVRRLEDLGLVTKSTRALTDRGRFLHDYVFGALQNAGQDSDTKTTLGIVEQVASDYGQKSGKALMNLVYGLTVPVFDLGGRPKKVRDIPPFLDILNPVFTPELGEVQPLTDELMADIDSELAIDPARLEPAHPAFQQTVRRALEKASA
jgi:uncharacterized protein YwgA